MGVTPLRALSSREVELHLPFSISLQNKALLLLRAWDPSLVHTGTHGVLETKNQDGDLGDGEAMVILKTTKEAEHNARVSNSTREWRGAWMA